MKLTLLQLVQRITDGIDSEAVSGVGETAESTMLVSICNRAFDIMSTSSRWRHFRRYSKLNAGTNLNEMVLPNGTFDIDNKSVYYNNSYIRYLRPDEFLSLTVSRNTAESNIQELANLIKVYNDRDPIWWSSIDDSTIIFDNIPNNINGVDSSLSRAIIYVSPEVQLTSDSEVFNLPARAFPALLDLAMSFALGELKGDSEEAQRFLREYKGKMARLSLEARVIDPQDDVRRSLVPRISSRRMLSPVRQTENGVIY